MQSIGVSRTWASIIGPSTIITGWFGKAISPSRIAYMFPVNLIPARYFLNPAYSSPGRNLEKKSSGMFPRPPTISRTSSTPLTTAQLLFSGAFR